MSAKFWWDSLRSAHPTVLLRRQTTMLKTKLLHPEILGVLGQAGHGSAVLWPTATIRFRPARR